MIEVGSRGPAIIWIAGVGWDETMGTDRRIVEELSTMRHVVWIDPPNRSAWPGWRTGSPPAVEGIGGTTRVRVPAPPGVTRWPFSILTEHLRRRGLARARRLGGTDRIVSANPLAPLPAGDEVKVLYITDDWVAGAPLMGFDEQIVARRVRANIVRAEGVAGVSPVLTDQASTVRPGIPALVLPNGAPHSSTAIDDGARLPLAGLIGQLNERLDLPLLHDVVDRGVRLRIVGPRVGSSPSFNDQLDRLMAHPNVDWRGRVPADEVRMHLAEITVGLTPYLDSAFNRASSPLKTLEYLSAGVPVVSSDLPASRWLNSPHVVVARTSAAFVHAAAEAFERPWDPEAARDRVLFAAGHAWRHRAESMIDFLDTLSSE